MLDPAETGRPNGVATLHSLPPPLGSGARRKPVNQPIRLPSPVTTPWPPPTAA